MARGLDDRQRAELSAFVNELAARAGYTTHAEWARDSGYPASNLSELRNGSAGIDGFNLLRLVRAAAERLGSDAASTALNAARHVPNGRSAEADLEARLQEVADLAAENFEILKDQLTDVIRRLPGEDAPNHQKRPR